MTVKVFIEQDNTVTLSCFQCKKTRTVDVSRFNNHRKIKVKCNCGNVSKIELEKRSQFRKKTDLTGNYHIFETKDTPPDSGTMTVVDISRIGVRIKFNSFPVLHPGDIVNIKFNLDDKNQSLIDRDVVVQNVKEPYAGARFHRANDMDSVIGFYLFK